MISIRSIAELYRLNAAELKRRLRRGLSKEDAEDDVQTAFLNILRHRPAVRNAVALAAAAAANAQRDRLRRSSQRISMASVAIDEAAWLGLTAPPDQEFELLLKQVVLSLPVEYRDAFVLNRFHGLTYEQVSEVLHVSPKSVEYRIAKALSYCQAALAAD